MDDSDFYPYGGERVITGSSSDNHYKFTGHERDTETPLNPLDHTLNRQYTSNVGRWLSPDPVRGKLVNPQSWNRYAYVIGSPVNFTDPKGADCLDPEDPLFGDCDGFDIDIGVCATCTVYNPYAFLAPFVGLTETGVQLVGSTNFNLTLPENEFNALLGQSGGSIFDGPVTLEGISDSAAKTIADAIRAAKRGIHATTKVLSKIATIAGCATSDLPAGTYGPHPEAKTPPDTDPQDSTPSIGNGQGGLSPEQQAAADRAAAIAAAYNIILKVSDCKKAVDQLPDDPSQP